MKDTKGKDYTNPARRTDVHGFLQRWCTPTTGGFPSNSAYDWMGSTTIYGQTHIAVEFLTVEKSMSPTGLSFPAQAFDEMLH